MTVFKPGQHLYMSQRLVLFQQVAVVKISINSLPNCLCVFTVGTNCLQKLSPVFRIIPSSKRTRLKEWLCFHGKDTKHIYISFIHIYIYLTQVHWSRDNKITSKHYCDVIMGGVASQITSLTIVYSSVYSDADQRKHQSSASLAFVREIHWGLVNSQHKWPVMQKMFPFDDVIMNKANNQMAIWC